MLKTLKAKIITLALVGTLAVGGAVYLTSVVVAGVASAAPAPVQTTQTANTAQLRAAVLEMMEDHMGLTGTEAATLADQMVARMQSAGADVDIQAMIDSCPRLNDDGAAGSDSSNYGPGMMNQNLNQNGSTRGRGALNGSGSGYSGSSGMMGGGMMGAWGNQR
jgi:hypothetical protein